MPPIADPNVLVGHATNDDAGIYRLSDDLALVQTVDFFTPVVDDPYDFGRIAAANALSDVYAMGGTPICALNIAAFPVEELGTDVLARILEGGAAIAAQAGIPIVGGHTIKDAEPKYGLAVSGTIAPDRVVRNAGARRGDVLVLTKRIGTGILTTARKRDAIDDAALEPAIRAMVRLNDRAARAMLAHGAHAATDVTGFGLIGHAREMARASGVALAIDAQRVPLFDGVLELIARDVVPAGTRDNLAEHAAFARYGAAVDEAMRLALSDAQTSGGLLIAVAREAADAICSELSDVDGTRHRRRRAGRAGGSRVRAVTRYDAIVLGTGGMGSAVAAHAAARGMRVLGLEQFGPAHARGSSHGGTRIIRQAYFESPAYVPMLRRAYALWDALEARTGVTLRAQIGGLFVGRPDAAIVAGTLASALHWQLAHAVYDANELRRRYPMLTPRDDEIGVYEAIAGAVFPEAAVRAQLDVAAECGAELRFGTQVEQWDARRRRRARTPCTRRYDRSVASRDLRRPVVRARRARSRHPFARRAQRAVLVRARRS